MYGTVPFGFTLSSALPLPAERVWERVTTMAGVNAELMPWVRMTVPREARGLRLSDATVGVPLFSSWVLVGGILPVDRHRLQLERVQAHYFLETSSSWLHSLWRHERTVAPSETGCRITDTVAFRPRVPLLGRLVLPIVRRIFAHRHRRLARWAQIASG